VADINSSMLPGPQTTSGLAIRTNSSAVDTVATARLTAVPYPRFAPVRSNRVPGKRSTASSGAPSVEPLSAITTVSGRSVATVSDDRNLSRCEPGE
jgi:hypothetical protein